MDLPAPPGPSTPDLQHGQAGDQGARPPGWAATPLAGIRAQIGHRRRPGQYGRKPSLAVDNRLDRRFDAEAPDKSWVTEITYNRTTRASPIGRW